MPILREKAFNYNRIYHVVVERTIIIKHLFWFLLPHLQYFGPFQLIIDHDVLLRLFMSP